jgi:hypothetical protein
MIHVTYSIGVANVTTQPNSASVRASRVIKLLIIVIVIENFITTLYVS